MICFVKIIIQNMESWECTICCESIVNFKENGNYPVILSPCGHGKICNKCCKQMIQGKDICPFCKRDIVYITPNIDLAENYGLEISLNEHAERIDQITGIIVSVSDHGENHAATLDSASIYQITVRPKKCYWLEMLVGLQIGCLLGLGFLKIIGKN